MDTPLLLYCYRPDWREFELAPCKIAIAKLEEHFGPGFVRAMECIGRNDYAQAVIDHWRHPGELIICEQDMEPSIDMVQKLIDCTALACGQAYWMMPASTGRFEPMLTIAEPGAIWAHHSAIGLVKLSAELRDKQPPPELVYWGHVENQINTRVQSGAQKWHIHYPACPHHHGLRYTDRMTDPQIHQRQSADLAGVK